MVLGNQISIDKTSGKRTNEQILSKFCLSCKRPFRFEKDEISFFNRGSGGAFHTKCALEADVKFDMVRNCTHVGVSRHIGESDSKAESVYLQSSEELPIDGLACYVSHDGMTDTRGTLLANKTVSEISRKFEASRHDNEKYPFFCKALQDDFASMADADQSNPLDANLDTSEMGCEEEHPRAWDAPDMEAADKIAISTQSRHLEGMDIDADDL